MTAGYLEGADLRRALNAFVGTLVEIAREAGLRATPGSVVDGMGFDYATPYLVVQGMYARGLISGSGKSPALTQSGLEFARIAVDVTSMIAEFAEFPETGRLLGAVVYALYDWSNTRRTASEQLEYAKRIRDELAALREKPELFKLAALLLPRMYYENGYTPLRLLESIRNTFSSR